MRNKKKRKSSLSDSSNEYVESLRNIIVFKVPLVKALRKARNVDCLSGEIRRANEITYLTYQYLALYWSYLVKNGIERPKIDKEFIFCIIRTVSSSTANNQIEKCKDSTKVVMKKLNKFYNNHFKKVLPKDHQKPIYDNIRQILDYEATSIVTCIKNHIVANFKESVNRYVNIVFDLQGKIRAIENNNKLSKSQIKNQIEGLKRELFHVKNDIIYRKNNCLKKHYVRKSAILKILNDEDYNKDKPLTYYATSNPLSFLDPLVRMSIKGERIMRNRLNDPSKMFNIIKCFPLRTTLYSKHVTYDTTQIIASLVKNNRTQFNRKISKYHKYIWDCFFKTNIRMFRKKGYVFNNMITTDGVSCNIFFIKEKLYVDKKNKKKGKCVKKPADYKDYIYVEDLTKEQKDEIKDTNIVGIDPGVDEIIHAVDGNVTKVTHIDGEIIHKPNSFRYTRMQKRQEIKSKKYTMIRESLCNNFIVSGKSIKEWEAGLSNYNLNTCIYNNLVKALAEKNKISNIVYDFYQNPIFRKLKYNHYINTQKSEARMINRFKERFGGPDKATIFIGDWSPQKGMRYKEPIKGKGLRDLFQRNGYKVYLIDEYNTSQRMIGTGDKMEKFKWIDNPAYKRELKMKKTTNQPKKTQVHGLLKNNTENKPDVKTVYMNRNVLGALNIREKGICHMSNKPEPHYLRRKNDNNIMVDPDSSDLNIRLNNKKVPVRQVDQRIMVKPKKKMVKPKRKYD